MTEKQLIGKIKDLKGIQPRTDWVVFTKEKIFEDKEPKSIISVISSFIYELQRGEKFVFQHKMAFVSVLLIVVFSGLFGFAQNSVPGDSLFVLKRFTEQSQGVFIADNYKSIHNFEIAGKRLDDLTKIAQNNNTKNLASAITEYNETVSKAAQSLGKIENVEDVASEVKKLQEKEDIVRSFGIEIAENKDLDNALAQIVKRELEDLKETELTEEQELVISDIEHDVEAGDYSAALEKVLLIEKNQ